MKTPMFGDGHGVLLWMLESTPEVDEEWNRWYNDEHVPALVEVPGVRTASRWVVSDVLVGTAPAKYLAFYELDDLGVLETDAYHRNRASLGPGMRREWTTQMLGAIVRAAGGAYRIDDTHMRGDGVGPATDLIAIGADSDVDEALRQVLDAADGISGWRTLTRAAGSPKIAGMMERDVTPSRLLLCAVDDVAAAAPALMASLPSGAASFAIAYERLLALPPHWPSMGLDSPERATPPPADRPPRGLA
ncbi:hypothetical protein [Microbacterium sp.]|uniref:hypothetical protein n=1 Tax=Microbacterium sp. TaxID=51671 RepID=UPI0039E34DAE